MTRALRRTEYGMRKLRTDTPYYKDMHASSMMSMSTYPNREEPYIRQMVDYRRPTAPTFSVMSYNILAEVNVIDNGQYRHTPSWALEYPYRIQNIIKEIETYDPDVVCLQEVDHDDEIAQHFEKRGYLSEFHPRGGRFPEGCQTLYKSSKFTLLDAERIRFNQIVEEYGVNKKDFRRSNIAQVLLLQMNGFDVPLCVSNAHLYWDPSFEYVKVAQAHYLMHQIDSIKKKHKRPFSTVLCGDFNSLPDSRVYELIKRGLPKERAKRKDVLLHAHGTPLTSAYERRGDPATNFAIMFSGPLDYIFYSKDTLSVNSLLEEATLKSPPLVKYSAAPNPVMPSDHVPLVAVFSCEKETDK